MELHFKAYFCYAICYTHYRNRPGLNDEFSVKPKIDFQVKQNFLVFTESIGLEECIMGGKMSNVSVLKLGRRFRCVPQLMYGRDRQIENSSKWADRGPRTFPQWQHLFNSA